jgi:hypothetical protein
MSKKPSMIEWLQDKIIDSSPEHKCVKIALLHSGTQKEIPPTFKFGSKQFKADALEQMFRSRAENFSEGTDGSQRFELLAFYENSNEPEDQFIFLSHKSQADLGRFDESADDKGIKQQSMRHLEATMRMALNHTQQLLEQSARQMTILANSNESLLNENREAFGIVKDMIMEKVNAQTDQKLKILQYERETLERKQWLKFAPPLINSIFGREVFPQSLEDTALIEAIAEKFSGEQIEKLAGSGMFPPELWGPLANRMNKFMKDKQEEEETIKQLAASAEKDAEADAAGDIINKTPQITEGEIVN